MAFESQTIDLDDTTLGLLRGGSGAPLIYLHGLIGDMHAQPDGLSAFEFHDKLAEQFDVVAPALPGYRPSYDALDAVLDLEDVHFLYTDLLDALQIERATLVGFGLGGWIAAEMATRCPERVERMALLAPLGISTSEAPINRNFFQACSPNQITRFLELRGYLFADHESEVANTLLPDEVKGDWQQTIRFANVGAARIGWQPQFFHNQRLPKRLRRVRANTRVFASRDDQMVPFANAQTYAEGIPGADLEEVEGGHMFLFEQPSDTAERVLKFLG